MTMRDIDKLVSHLKAAQKILVFTGAGISTNSGIPDFRGPQGVWQRRQPVYFDEFLASADKRREYWEFKYEGYLQFRDAKPNVTHECIAELQRRGRVVAVVTQNIDGLHQAAGASGVIELHGTNAECECVSCGARSQPAAHMDEFARTRECPRCGCGGFVKMATISFGQALKPQVTEAGFAAARRCDLVLALGSTLSVHPAASIPLEAKRHGAALVIINRGATDQDDEATLRLEGDVAAILPPAVAAALA
jgi:NAD-dependent deacetylase